MFAEPKAANFAAAPRPVILSCWTGLARRAAANFTYSLGPPVVHRATKSRNWRTPPEIIDLARAIMGSIDLDPCASPNEWNHFARLNYTGQPRDGLSEPWTGTVFVNAPSGRGLISKFWSKGREEAGRTTAQIYLIPAWTGSKDVQDILEEIDTFAVSPRRLRFIGAPNYSMFPSMLVIRTHRPEIQTAFFEITNAAGWYQFASINAHARARETITPTKKDTTPNDRTTNPQDPR